MITNEDHCPNPCGTSITRDSELFSEMVLGNPAREADAKEVLSEFIATISPAEGGDAHRVPKRRGPSATAVSRPSSGQLFAQAMFGAPPNDGGANQECFEFVAAISNLREADWDPAKHPRGGFSQNRGWFSQTSGSGRIEKSPLVSRPTAATSDRVDRGQSRILTVSDKAPKRDEPASDLHRRARAEYTEKRWIERADATETRAGGTVKLETGPTVRIRVFDKASIKTRVDGQWTKDDSGNVRILGGNLVQFEATSPDCDALHWIQFYKETQFDENGKPIAGQDLTKDAIFRDFDSWYVDAPAPSNNAKPDPNHAYYDNPAADNAHARNQTSISIFDQGNGSDLQGDATKGVITFRTYLIANGKVHWEIAWDQVTRFDANDQLQVGNENFKGRATNRFDKPLDTPRWNLGMPTQPIPGAPGKVRALKPATLPNPFLQR